MSSATKVSVLGGGAWGTALAIHAARLGHRVELWLRDPELAETIERRRENPVYLPGVAVPKNLAATTDLVSAISECACVIAVVPTQHARGVLQAWAERSDSRPPVVVANKGIEEGTLALPTDIVRATLGADVPVGVLSGPSFALEFAGRRPTTLVAASEDPELAERLQRWMSGENLRLYTNEDPVGVQVGAALKNVIAIAAGAAQGLGLGHNVLAALVTRGLAELARLGRALGGRAETFAGLAGLGDLVLTCQGEASRNRHVGIALAEGERLADILSSRRAVAEGVPTTRSARALAHREDVAMPIVEEVHRMLFDGGTPDEAVRRLMSRPLTTEHEPSS